MKAVSNLRSGTVKRATLGILPLALSLTAMCGFAVRPGLDIQEAEALRRHAEHRVAECVAEKKLCASFVDQGGFLRLERALDRVRELIPREATELELHSVVRIAAKATSFNLQAVSIDEPRDIGLARLGDLVVVREIDVRGVGSLGALPELVSMLRGFGYPTAVLEFTTSRQDEASSHYRTQAVLGVFAVTDPPPVSADGPLPFEGEMQ